MVHTDDRSALLEVARQLDVVEEFGDHISVSKISAPIFFYLIIILQLSFAAALNYILDALRTGKNNKLTLKIFS